MEKTVILGNNPDAWWMQDIKGASRMSIPNLSVGRYDSIALFVGKLPTDLECIVIDSDSMSSNELALSLTLFIRLMLSVCKQTALSSIIIVSELSRESFKGYGVNSMVLMTDGVMLVRGESVGHTIGNAQPLSAGEYIEGFINLIKVAPREKIEGRHSIANYWGAHILSMIIKETVHPEYDFSSIDVSPYFLYSSIAPLTADDVLQIITNSTKNFYCHITPLYGKFSYLLIDDEARQGWDKALGELMPSATQEVWDKPIGDYSDLPEEFRDKIRSGAYHVIFLDLRMKGIEEEMVVKPLEFSGMKILEGIKKVNPGQQVIMLTATNKAWNLKALLDSGANGYYMKESPEYHFSLKYSKQNAEEFKSAIKTCIDNSYLAQMHRDMNKALNRLSEDNALSLLYSAVKTNWDAAFILLQQNQFRDGLLQLMLALEAYANQYTSEIKDEERAVVYSKDTDFSMADISDFETDIYDDEKSQFEISYGRLGVFHRGKIFHPIDISVAEDYSDKRIRTLNLPLKVAAVIHKHLADTELNGVKKICELIFIRNNRLAHHGVASEYDEDKRPINRGDCRFVFNMTYNLIMAI